MDAVRNGGFGWEEHPPALQRNGKWRVVSSSFDPVYRDLRMSRTRFCLYVGFLSSNFCAELPRLGGSESVSHPMTTFRPRSTRSHLGVSSRHPRIAAMTSALHLKEAVGPRSSDPYVPQRRDCSRFVLSRKGDRDPRRRQFQVLAWFNKGNYIIPACP